MNDDNIDTLASRLDEGVANELSLLLDDGGGVDGVSSQVGVGHWLVDGGNNRGNTWDIVVGVVVVRTVVCGGIEERWVSLSLALDEGVSNEVSLLLDDGGGVDGVSSQVGVGDWLVDGGNNWSNPGNVVVGVVVVGAVVGWGEEEGWVSISVTLGKSVILQGLDSATLSSDAVVWGVKAALGNDGTSGGGVDVGIGVGIGISGSGSEEDLWVSFGFPLVQAANSDG